MMYEYASIFAGEIADYMASLIAADETIRRIRITQSALRSFDRYLVSVALGKKHLSEQDISDWQKPLDLCDQTKSRYVFAVRNFSKYLVSIGICANPLERPKKSMYTCASILSEEIEEYLRILAEMGQSIDSKQSVLRSIDQYLVAIEYKQKSLPLQLLTDWQASRDVAPRTRGADISAVTGFTRYLISVGIQADCPEYAERKKHTSYAYASVFADEIADYLKFLSEIGRDIHGPQSVMRGLDRYLVSINLEQKSLPAEIVSDWLTTLNITPLTKFQYTSKVKGFAKYLLSLGIHAGYPEHPLWRNKYVPYVFSDAEIEQIFDVADSLTAGTKMTRANRVFPFLLRILYGCGLRIEECCSLKWRDVDTDRGIITIREAKNLKQRFVPMDSSLTETLKRYHVFIAYERICADYLFESDKSPGHPFRQNTFYEWFKKVLEKTDIKYIKPSETERGLCPHCIRHTFTLKSFLKHDDMHESYEDYALFLAAFLGHDGPAETEEYLRSNYAVYTKSHQRVNAAIGNLFPKEVCFDEA